MPTEDVIGQNGEILPKRGLRGESALGVRRRTVRTTIEKPRRNARKDGIINDPLELRAAPGVAGSLLERIVYRRLSILIGETNFIYKYQVGAATGVKDARAFAGGVEMDFVILNRPSGKELDLEIQGSHWHGPIQQYADMERALTMLSTGRDYAEIWDHEIMLGDDYLDQRLIELVGAYDKVPYYESRSGEGYEIPTFDREILARQT